MNSIRKEISTTVDQVKLKRDRLREIGYIGVEDMDYHPLDLLRFVSGRMDALMRDIDVNRFDAVDTAKWEQLEGTLSRIRDRTGREIERVENTGSDQSTLEAMDEIIDDLSRLERP